MVQSEQIPAEGKEAHLKPYHALVIALGVVAVGIATAGLFFARFALDAEPYQWWSTERYRVYVLAGEDWTKVFDDEASMRAEEAGAKYWFEVSVRGERAVPLERGRRTWHGYSSTQTPSAEAIGRARPQRAVYVQMSGAECGVRMMSWKTGRGSEPLDELATPLVMRVLAAAGDRLVEFAGDPELAKLVREGGKGRVELDVPVVGGPDGSW